MRISVTVKVFNRLSSNLNIDKRRPEKSYLSVGYVNKEKDKIYILHQTIKNGVGIKYKVLNNVKYIFDKFISEGKATLRFLDPPVDLIIKGEANEVKRFIEVVKIVLRHDASTHIQSLSNLHAAPTRVISEPTTKLTIKSKFDNPTFSRSCEYVSMTNAGLGKFDNRILRLQKLRVLHLEGNYLEEIPSQIDLLPVLEELHLANNLLGTKSNFEWLRSSSLHKTLLHLDLSKNKILYVPTLICRLKNLKELLLSQNDIKRLPPAIGHLQNLKDLDVSSNELKWLPGSFLHLKLNSLNLSKNKWMRFALNAPHLPNIVGFESLATTRTNFSLLNLAATVVLLHRLKYTEETLPRTLIDYLEEAGYCICGRPHFPESPTSFYLVERVFKGKVYTKEENEYPVIGLTGCTVHEIMQCITSHKTWSCGRHFL